MKGNRLKEIWSKGGCALKKGRPPLALTAKTLVPQQGEWLQFVMSNERRCPRLQSSGSRS